MTTRYPTMEEINKETEELNEKLSKEFQEHLEKFREDGLDKLLDEKYLDYYYDLQNDREIVIENDKNKYRQYLKDQILRYINYLESANEWKFIDWDEAKIIEGIENKYHELIYHGEKDMFLVGEQIKVDYQASQVQQKELGPKGNKVRNFFSGLIASILTKKKEE